MNTEKIKNELIRNAEIRFIRSPGPGGQNVNKVSTGVYLRIDLNKTSIPEYIKNKILQLTDSHISANGIINIKSNTFRTQEKNKKEAFRRLKNIINKALIKKKKRLKTKPTTGSKIKRLEKKRRRGEIKKNRSRNFSE